jgi:hypothetical protein
VTSSSLQNLLAFFLPVANHVIEVETYKGRDPFGTRQLDPTTVRQYSCYIQYNERTAWNVEQAVDGMPYIAYVLSIPIGQTTAFPIRVEEQLTIISAANPDLDGTTRRLGTVKTYSDQYGDNAVYTVTFE